MFRHPKLLLLFISRKKTYSYSSELNNRPIQTLIINYKNWAIIGYKTESDGKYLEFEVMDMENGHKVTIYHYEKTNCNYIITCDYISEFENFLGLKNVVPMFMLKLPFFLFKILRNFIQLF